MRKLHKAAVAATVIGTFGMLGAGVAAAGEVDPPLFACAQNRGEDSETAVTGLINVGDALVGGSGDAESATSQQSCGLGNGNNTNTGGDAESGTGGGGTVGITTGA